MAYLEELLPEFRKGAKIRSHMWSKKAYIHFKDGKILDESGLPYTIPAIAFHINDWELYKEPEEEETKVAGLLADYDSSEVIFSRYRGKNSVTHYDHCRPVQRDEVTFYEDKKD